MNMHPFMPPLPCKLIFELLQQALWQPTALQRHLRSSNAAAILLAG